MCAGRSNQQAIYIRRARREDAAAVAHCLAAAFAPYRDRYTAGAFADTVLSTDGVTQRLASMTILVAEDGTSAIVGTIALAQHGEEGHLRGMAVLPDRHGHGIAERLLAAAENELGALGCSAVTLDTTEPLERAMRFYEKHGFQRSGRTSDFFGMRLIEYRKALEYVESP